MSRLDELPPDQRAALALVLAQGKSYADVASLLHIDERAVHDRAHAALAVLDPAHARGLTPDQRALIGDYLLGQLGIAERLRVRGEIAASEPQRVWALSIAAELSPLAPRGLPEIPEPLVAAEPAPEPGTRAPAAEPAVEPPPAAAGSELPSIAPSPPPPAPEGVSGAEHGPPEPAAHEELHEGGPDAPPSSRLGGALVLAAIVVAVAVAVILITSGGSSHSHKSGSSTGTSASSATGTSGTSGTSTGPAITARIALRPTEASSHSIGLLQVLQEGSTRAFYVIAENMPATHGFFYALWLYNNPESHEPLGKAPPVGSSHRLEGGGSLPANAGDYHEVLLTRETSTHATHPGPTVLRGTFTLSGEST